jgi:hypothetical protein
MKAQMASPTFTHVYAALVAVVNTKFPENGELIVKRCHISRCPAVAAIKAVTTIIAAATVATVVDHERCVASWRVPSQHVRQRVALQARAVVSTRVQAQRQACLLGNRQARYHGPDTSL